MAYSKKRVTKYKHKDFVRMWNEGVSIEEMAKKLEVSQNCIQDYARKNRAKCPKRMKRKITDHKKFVTMWNQGASSRVISETFNISQEWVCIYASKHRDECPKKVSGRKKKS